MQVAGVFLARFAELAAIRADLASVIRGFDGELSEKSDKSNGRSDDEGCSGL
jgi:hypothetical protein